MIRKNEGYISPYSAIRIRPLTWWFEPSKKRYFLVLDWLYLGYTPTSATIVEVYTDKVEVLKIDTLEQRVEKKEWLPIDPRMI